MKFKYRGEFNGRMEFGTVEAKDVSEAMAQLCGNGIDVKGLDAVPELANTDEEYRRWLGVMNNWERVHSVDPKLIAGDPKAQQLLRGAAQARYPDIAERAKQLLQKAGCKPATSG